MSIIRYKERWVCFAGRKMSGLLRHAPSCYALSELIDGQGFNEVLYLADGFG